MLDGASTSISSGRVNKAGLYDRATRKLRMIGNGLLVPTRSIPREGRSDGRPLIHGIRHYADFFNDRQKLHLHLLGSAINRMESDEARRCLELAFSEHLTTNCMYTAYAFGYRRTSPMFSIHSYRHITRPVELNPWQDGVGRGTFINTVRKISKAIAFAKAPEELHPEGTRVAYEDDFEREQACLGSVDDVLSGSAPDNGSPGPAPPSRHEGTSLSAAARLGRACSHLRQDQLTLAFALPWPIGHGDLAGTSRPQQPGSKSSGNGQLRRTTPRAARAPPGHRLRAPPRRRDRTATAGVPSPRARKDRSLHRRP